jgi:hypothetical protein
MCWHTPVIPVTQKATLGGSQFKNSPGKKYETLSEKQLNGKGLEA